MVVLLWTLIAHAAADFLFQSDRMVARKNNLQWQGFFYHGIILFGLLVGFLQAYRLASVLIYSVWLTAIHLGIDLVKVFIGKMNGTKGLKVSTFMIDQILHLFCMLILWQHFVLPGNPWIVKFYTQFFTPKLAALAGMGNVSMVTSEKILLVLLIYLWVCYGGAFFVRNILQSINFPKLSQITPLTDPSMQRAGYYIGILERALILTLVWQNSINAVAFIFTAKSIARFNELNNRDFAEYYLLGTLSSTVLGIVGGLVLNFLVNLV